MRKMFSLVAAGLLTGSAAAFGQQPVAPVSTGITDFGMESTRVEGDAARFQRYGDQVSGATFHTFRFDRQGANWRFESAADHVGRRDQRFAGTFIGASKVKVSFLWDQMPTFFTADARSPYVIACDHASRRIPRALGSLGVPAIYGLPLGHTKHLAALPLGLTCTLDADAKTLTVDEPALR